MHSKFIQDISFPLTNELLLTMLTLGPNSTYQHTNTVTNHRIHVSAKVRNILVIFHMVSHLLY